MSNYVEIKDDKLIADALGGRLCKTATSTSGEEVYLGYGTDIAVERKDGCVIRIAIGNPENPSLIIQRSQWGSSLEVLGRKTTQKTFYLATIVIMDGMQPLQHSFPTKEERDAWVEKVRSRFNQLDRVSCCETYATVVDES